MLYRESLKEDIRSLPTIGSQRRRNRGLSALCPEGNLHTFLPRFYFKSLKQDIQVPILKVLT